MVNFSLSHKKQIRSFFLLLSFMSSALFAQMQENHKFIRETLSVIPTASPKLEDTIDIECGYYFDNNADGFVDSLFIKVTTNINGGLTADHVQELIDSTITLPDFRHFTINSSGVVSGGFYIDVIEENTNPTTYVNSEDKLVVRNDILTTGGYVPSTTAPIYDRIAPLIHWEGKAAYLIDYQVDSIAETLTVKFSENVSDIIAEQPFLFLNINENIQYNVRLTRVSHNNNIVKFTVIGLSPVQYMKDGDSIWIQRTDRVGDTASPINYQNNNNNTRRRLWVERRLVPYGLITNSTSPFDFGNITTNIIPDNLIDVLNNIDPNYISNNNLETNNNGEFIGMIITVMPSSDPDIMLPDFKLRGFLSISDTEGNQVVTKEKMLWWYGQKSLIWIWNIKNEYGYYVSPGIYNCFIEIEEITQSLGYANGGPKETRRLQVGVKGAGSDCGSCGTSAELAFIPPIGFKLASMARRRKRWWRRLLERLRLKRKQT